ncbi:MAG: hypothetical protein HYY00_00525 [Chloroflexi bacterium]|nr:hypothetical protein [Chloroflexota bacterium]
MSKGRLASDVVEFEDSLERVNEEVMRRGWGDGLPVIPPTEERVWRMVEACGRDPQVAVGIVGPMNGVATVEKIAVNAVMAGCRPEYMPVLIAAVGCLQERQFNIDAVQATTNPCAVGVIINGPVRGTLSINCRRGCLGPGAQANATIGRAMRLILLNVGGAKNELVDKAIHGFPGKYSFCFGEDEENSPWEPLHVERGFKPEQSTVTVFAPSGTLNVHTATCVHWKDMLMHMADGMGQMAGNNVLLGRGEPGIIVTSGHASLAIREGMSKQDVKRFLYEHSAFPESRLSPDLMRLERIEPVIKDGMVHVARRPEDIMVLVAGGPEPYHAVFLPIFGDSWMVTKEII